MQKISADTTAQRLIADLHRLSEPKLRADKQYEIAKYYIDKPGEEKQDIQAAQNYCSGGLKLSLQQKLPQALSRGYALQAQIFREKGDQANARKFADRALSLLPQFNDPVTYADVYLEKSSYYTLDADSNLAQKIKYYNLGVIYLREAYPNSLRLADALKYLGDIYGLQQGGNVIALPLLYEALAIYKLHKYGQLQAIYDLIGATLSRMERRREGLKYSLLAVRTAEKYKDSSMTTCAIYNRLAYTYNNLNEDHKAAECMEKAIIYARHNHDETTAYILISNLAVAYIDLKAYDKALNITQQAITTVPKDHVKIRMLFMIDLVRIYTAMKKYKLAEPLYNKLEQLSEHATNLDIVKDLMYSAGINLFMKLHKYDRVNSLIVAYKAITVKAENLMAMSRAEEFAYKVDSAQQNFKGAFLHHQAFKKLSDSLVNRNHDKETAQLQLQYETEKKDVDIAEKAKNIRLLTRQTELQGNALKSEALIRNLSIVAVAMLLILSAVIYNRYQLKRRANQELEEQQEEINTQNDYLKQLVTEREWLLKEVHHRVKNNLQIVISLLNSQSAYIDSPSAKEVIRESKNRVNSISLIHQKLYQTDDLGGVDMYHYIYELVDHIATSFGTHGRIAFELAPERITLDVSQAVPLGLIINEALTNAVKYAFFPGQDANITVRLLNTPDGVCLQIADNGQGLPENFDTRKSTSLGMNLMHGLSKQLGGKLIVRSHAGLDLSLTFQANRLLAFPQKKDESIPIDIFA